MWAQPGLWEHVFEHASNVFAVLSLAAELATEEISDTRSLTSKRRRAILDAAAWARDAVICLLGHCFHLVAASYTSLAGSKSGNIAWPRSLPFPEDFDDYEDYKCAMTDFNSGVRSAMYQKFLSLRSASPSEASKFLSACFRKDKNFEVALTDEESGHLLSIQQASEPWSQITTPGLKSIFHMITPPMRRSKNPFAVSVGHVRLQLVLMVSQRYPAQQQLTIRSLTRSASWSWH